MAAPQPAVAAAAVPIALGQVAPARQMCGGTCWPIPAVSVLIAVLTSWHHQGTGEELLISDIAQTPVAPVLMLFFEASPVSTKTSFFTVYLIFDVLFSFPTSFSSKSN